MGNDRTRDRRDEQALLATINGHAPQIPGETRPHKHDTIYDTTDELIDDLKMTTKDMARTRDYLTGWLQTLDMGRKEGQHP